LAQAQAPLFRQLPSVHPQSLPHWLAAAAHWQSPHWQSSPHGQVFAAESPQAVCVVMIPSDSNITAAKAKVTRLIFFIAFLAFRSGYGRIIQ